MPRTNIPKNEMDNVLSVYWQLLREVESKTHSKPNGIDICLVEGAYKVLNRIKAFGKSNLEPEWAGKEDFPSNWDKEDS